MIGDRVRSVPFQPIRSSEEDMRAGRGEPGEYETEAALGTPHARGAAKKKNKKALAAARRNTALASAAEPEPAVLASHNPEATLPGILPNGWANARAALTQDLGATLALGAMVQTKNPLTALNNLHMQQRVINEKLRGLLGAENRHGELQVIRSAARLMIANLDVLILAEESD